MRLSSAKMYARMLASDASCDGQFFTGVLTTGIYCLPSCRARKPRPENVRFFPSCQAARAAGLRPCKKCHPDDYERGADPVLESIEALITAIRSDPASFSSIRQVVARSGFGATRLFELIRLHYHATPAELLVRARITAAQRLLQPGPGRAASDGEDIASIAFQVGFESVSVFYEHFRRLTGLAPGAYRDLERSNVFNIQLPEGYSVFHLRQALARDELSVSERLVGDEYVAAVVLPSTAARLRLHLQPEAIGVELEPLGPATPALIFEAHATVAHLLGLDEDLEAFGRLVQELGLSRLTDGRRGLRLIRTPSIFDGIVWSIVGQQVNLPFARLLRRRLTERCGQRLDDGLVTPPTPAAVAALEPADLLALQFSRQKANYLLGVARALVGRQLDLQLLPTASAARVERTLRGIRGLGPWSINYVMMRSLGFADCVPYGDTGLTSGLQQLFQLDPRPDVDATRRLMSVFSPYRSLATTYIWNLNQPPAP
jgi:AraC family transcriptional regulator, regulatory protein of adaptative response / DNA-3-methyladenine glycosylase II